MLDNDQVCDTVNPNDMPPFCDDDRTATFYVDSDRGTKDCAWLRRHPTNINLLNRLCRPSHAAYHACAETCGNCTDNCRDRSTGTFFVNSQLGRKDCAWLSTQPLARQDALCYSGHRAFAMCQERAIDAIEWAWLDGRDLGIIWYSLRSFVFPLWLSFSCLSKETCRFRVSLAC